jgi:hypothetical protein
MSIKESNDKDGMAERGEADVSYGVKRRLSKG